MPKAVTPEALAENCKAFVALMVAMVGAGQMPTETADLCKYLQSVADVPQVAALLCDKLAPPEVAGKTWGRA